MKKQVAQFVNYKNMRQEEWERNCWSCRYSIDAGKRNCLRCSHNFMEIVGYTKVCDRWESKVSRPENECNTDKKVNRKGLKSNPLLDAAEQFGMCIDVVDSLFGKMFCKAENGNKKSNQIILLFEELLRMAKSDCWIDDWECYLASTLKEYYHKK